MRLDKTRKFITEKLKDHFIDTNYYHSLEHSFDVEKACVEIISHRKDVGKKEEELIRVAALFHDIGYKDSTDDHERQSCVCTEKILPELEFSREEINFVNQLIMATRFPHDPKNQYEEIICDADLSYLGNSENYFEQSEKLRTELIHLGNELLKNDELWYKYQFEFLSSHRYFTQYAIEKFSKGKNMVLTALRMKLNREL